MNMDPAGSVKQKIDLVWPNYGIYITLNMHYNLLFAELNIKNGQKSLLQVDRCCYLSGMSCW